MDTQMKRNYRVLLIVAAIAVSGGLLALLLQVHATRVGAPPASHPAAAPSPASVPGSRPSTAAARLTVKTGNDRKAEPQQQSTVDGSSAALTAAIRASAPVSAPWTVKAGEVMTRANGVTLGGLECHQAGCIATVTYADELAFELGDESLSQSEEFQSYPGWRHRSYHTEPSGQVVATWFFMNPSRP